jgi:hypothetical protein
LPEAPIEKDYEPLQREQLTVWDKDHPVPKATGPDFERKLLRWFTDDAEEQIRAAASSPDEFRKLVGAAVEVLIGRTYDTAGDSEWNMTEKVDRGNYLEMTGLIRNQTYNEELPVVWLYPKKWNGRVILWLDDAGKSALYDQDSSLKSAVAQLVNGGATVLGVDLLYQGEFLYDGEPVKQTRTVANKREAPAYTFGYNHALIAQRAHDVLTLIKTIRTEKIDSIPSPSFVAVAAFGHAGPIAVLARAVSDDSIDAAAIDTGGFRFGKLLDYRAPQFLPGGAKYLDVPGMLALGLPHRLWLTGEKTAPAIVSDRYRRSGKAGELTVTNSDSSQSEAKAASWLLE